MNEIHMNSAGWLFLGATWGAILVLTAFCVLRLFRASRKRDSGGPQE